MPKSAPHGCNGHRGSAKCVWTLVLTTISVLVLAGCSNSGASAAGAPGAPGGKGGGKRGAGGDVPVTVAVATQKNVPVEVQVIGNVEAYSTISVKAQVTGQVTEVFFHEGEY